MALQIDVGDEASGDLLEALAEQWHEHSRDTHLNLIN